MLGGARYGCCIEAFPLAGWRDLPQRLSLRRVIRGELADKEAGVVCIEALKTPDIGALPRICERCPAHSFLDGSAAIPLRDIVHEGYALRCCSIGDGGAKEDDGCALECASGKRLHPLDAIRSCIAGKASDIECMQLGERSPAPSMAAECNPEEGQEQKDENDGGHLIPVSG